jgi:branched-chain amino acid transport system ATP-binding protein
VLENLQLATYARKNTHAIDSDLERVFTLFPHLARRKHQRGDTLSGGEQQMLAVGRAFMTGVRFILLDEPSMGLAPRLMHELFLALKDLHETGATILFVEQNVHLALKYAHRAYVLEAGRIVMEGSSQELAGNPEIQKAYLG